MNEQTKIRLIAVDMDGTLLGAQGEIPEENIVQLRRAMQKGAKLVLASGRMIESMLPTAEKLAVNAPIIAMNGGLIYDPMEKRILSGTTIPCEIARRVAVAIESDGGYVQAFPGFNYYFEKRCAWTDYYAGKIHFEGIEAKKPISQWIQSDMYKLLYLGEAENLTACAAKWQQHFPEVRFVRSAPCHLEIVAAEVSKAGALRELGNMLNISAEEMLAFGDELNDLDMINYVGTGYIMQNAPEYVLKQAKRVCPSNLQAGVGKIVRLFVDEDRLGD